MFNEVLLFHNVILTFTLYSFITKTSARSWNKLDISRRKALLFCADIPHPDIGNFVCTRYCKLLLQAYNLGMVGVQTMEETRVYLLHMTHNKRQAYILSSYPGRKEDEINLASFTRCQNGEYRYITVM